MSRTDIDDVARAAASESKEVRQDLRQTLLAGVTLTVPFFITTLVFLWAFGTVTDALSPLVGVLNTLGLTSGLSSLLTQLTAATLVVGLILFVGMAAQHGPDTNLATRIDTLMEDLPGVGSIYTSVERMSDVIVDGDTESFREVKLVEFPREGNFALAFLTADTPAVIEAAADCENMVTIFVPMAPNPVMGGHLVNLSADRVYDVDLSVEEGMQAIVTTGMAIDEGTFDEVDGTVEI